MKQDEVSSKKEIVRLDILFKEKSEKEHNLVDKYVEGLLDQDTMNGPR